MIGDPPKAAIQKLDLGGLLVLGEQDGPPEQILKGRLDPVLARHTQIRSAYLVRLNVVASGERTVAVCLVSTSGPSEGLAREIAGVFAETFGPEDHLDIVFLRPDQERRVSSVSSSFYSGPLP